MPTLKFTPLPLSPSIDAEMRDVLTRFPSLVLALVFGSVAQGRQRADSDLDIAVAANQALTSGSSRAKFTAL